MAWNFTTILLKHLLFCVGIVTNDRFGWSVIHAKRKSRRKKCAKRMVFIWIELLLFVRRIEIEVIFEHTVKYYDFTKPKNSHSRLIDHFPSLSKSYSNQPTCVHLSIEGYLVYMTSITHRHCSQTNTLEFTTLSSILFSHNCNSRHFWSVSRIKSTLKRAWIYELSSSWGMVWNADHHYNLMEYQTLFKISDKQNVVINQLVIALGKWIWTLKLMNTWNGFQNAVWIHC